MSVPQIRSLISTLHPPKNQKKRTKKSSALVYWTRVFKVAGSFAIFLWCHPLMWVTMVHVHTCWSGKKWFTHAWPKFSSPRNMMSHVSYAHWYKYPFFNLMCNIFRFSMQKWLLMDFRTKSSHIFSHQMIQMHSFNFEFSRYLCEKI